MSPHTANAAIKHRPHSINNYPILVKRLYPKDKTESPPEQHMRITRLVFTESANGSVKYEKVQNLFKTFGTVTHFEHFQEEKRFVVEFDDYDTVDRLLIEKDYRSCSIEVDRKCLVDTSNTSEYYSFCRRKAEIKPVQEKSSTKSTDAIRERDLALQQRNQEIVQLRSSLKKKDEDFLSLTREHATLQQNFAELEKKAGKERKASSCASCQQHRTTILQLKEEIVKLNELNDKIQRQYQELLASRQNNNSPVPASDTASFLTRKISFSTRLNKENSKVNSVLPLIDAVDPQRRNPSDQAKASNMDGVARQRPFTPSHQSRYQYESVVKDDQ